MATTTVQPIETQDAFDSAIASAPPGALVVIYFHAPWAAPCAQMSTVLEALASTHPKTDPPKVIFLSLNAEDLPDVSEDYDVTAVPFIALRRDGKVVETVSGSDAAKVRAAVDKHAAAAGSKTNGAQLPPAQQVTRPDRQPAPAVGAPPSAAPAPTTNGTRTNGTATKDLSSYAPASNDAPPAASEAAPAMTKEELNTRLQQLTNAAPCMLFMKGTPSAPQCGFSRQLVSILRKNNVRYGFFNILADEDVRQGLKEYADWPTFPQLWLSGELVGGLDIVKEEIDANPEFFQEFAVEVKNKDTGQTAA